MSLSPEQWEMVGEIFDAVSELPPDAQMEAVSELAVDDEVKAEVVSLLAAASSSRDFLKSSPAKSFLQTLGQRHALREFTQGEEISGFELIRCLGKGASATVYLARDKSLDRLVALKIRSSANLPEAQMMAKLEHDHIVRVFSELRVQAQNIHIICMQYVPGATLQEILFLARTKGLSVIEGRTLLDLLDEIERRNGSRVPFDINRREFIASLDNVELVAWYGANLCDALDFAHRNGVLHFDIKPANILVDHHGRPFVADFSISRSASNAVDASFGGTLGYMSPEHSKAFHSADASEIEALDARTDIYSLGVVLSELIGSENRNTTPASNVGLGEVLAKCKASKKEERFASAHLASSAFLNIYMLRQLEKKLPEVGAWLGHATRRPLRYLLACALLPQVCGSIVNTTYNISAIVARLSVEQQAAFAQFTIYYNLVVYPFCIWFFTRALIGVRAVARAHDADECRALRSRVLNAPMFIFIATTIGWVPGAFLFPYYISSVTKTLPLEIYNHFAISFLMSWMVAFSYSTLFTRDLVTRVLYPRLLIWETNIQKVAQEELMPLVSRIRFVQIVAIAIPLLAAALMIVIGPEQFQKGDYALFRTLVVSVLSLGFIGLFFVNSAVDKILGTIRTLSGIQRRV